MVSEELRIERDDQVNKNQIFPPETPPVGAKAGRTAKTQKRFEIWL